MSAFGLRVICTRHVFPFSVLCFGEDVSVVVTKCL